MGLVQTFSGVLEYVALEGNGFCSPMFVHSLLGLALLVVVELADTAKKRLR